MQFVVREGGDSLLEIYQTHHTNTPIVQLHILLPSGGSQEKKKTRASMQAHGRQYRPVGPAKFAIRDPMHRVGVALPPFISRPACARVYQGLLPVCQSLSFFLSLFLALSLYWPTPPGRSQIVEGMGMAARQT